MRAQIDVASATRPNFFIVGAAKAGTTALHECLAQHPDVFMSKVKEPCYFSSDLGLPQPWAGDLDRYLSLFSDGAARPVRGESTPAYLLSSEAADRIRTFCPEARILIVIRNPIDAIRSIFAEARKFGIEPERTFAAALATSDVGRPKLESKPGGAWLRYRHVVRYAAQVERYKSAFPPEQLHIALYDELVSDPAGLCSDVLRFLGVDSSVQLELRRVNEQRFFRYAFLQRLYMRPYRRGSPPETPRRLRRTWNALLQLNVVAASGTSIEAGLRQDLIDDLGPDVVRLGSLIDRDLSHWLTIDRN